MLSWALEVRVRERVDEWIRVARLGRWLGPWARPDAAPPVSPPRAGAAPVLVIPGLHFLGVEDPRFRRLMAILGATGARVEGLALAELARLELAPSMLEAAERELVRLSDEAGPVGLMSISFGSVVALHLAATHPERVRRAVLFGGYAELGTAFRFALGGAVPGHEARIRDPLNAPAVFLNLVDELLAEGEREAFKQAARVFCERTWTRGAHAAEHDKHDGRHLRVGAELAEALTGEARHLMRVACRLEGDPLPVAEAALAKARERFAFLEPAPLLSAVSCPVTCVHGRDDDVIPYTESERLAARLPNAEVLLTGLYGHTGHRLPNPGSLLAETATLVRVLAAFGRLTGPERRG